MSGPTFMKYVINFVTDFTFGGMKLDGLTRDANNGLYTMRGLEKARAALAPGGVLAVWSAGPDPAFTRRMRDAGFAVEEVQVRARSNGKGPRHVIWFGTKRK